MLSFVDVFERCSFQSVDFLQLKVSILYNKNSVLEDNTLFFYGSTLKARCVKSVAFAGL